MALLQMASKKNSPRFPKRGEVYWVDLEPVRGGETQKKRPGLVVSNNIGNEFSNIVMVAPITSNVNRVYPTEAETTIAGKPAKIMVHQCRALDKSRLLNKIDTVDQKTMTLVASAIEVVFAL